jgi:hypothetical protein
MIGKRRDQAAEDARTIARVRGALEGCLSAGTETVPVGYVLGLLGPDGPWRQAPGQHEAQGEATPASAARASSSGIDPITGCRSVTPAAPDSTEPPAAHTGGSVV